MKWIERFYALSLYAYPRSFRQRFGSEMRQLFRDRCRDAFREPTPARVAAFFVRIAHDWIRSSLRERINSMTRFPKLAYTAAAAILLLAAPVTVLRAYVISGGSMEGTLRIGDHLVVNKLVGHLRHGEMVVFASPTDPSQTFIKRVIGLPGDRLQIVNKQVIRNGQPLIETYVSHISSYADERRDNFPPQGEFTVPEGQVFVLGDNRDNSLDSRYWGAIPQASILARPWFIYWSRDPVAGVTRWDRTPLVVR